MKYLVTGSAGFIGFHLSLRLLRQGHAVIGVDNLNNYYDLSLKKARNKILLSNKKYEFKKLDIKNYKKLEKIFKKNRIDTIFHMAAQAGIRNSILNPQNFIDDNIIGFLNILELCKNFKIKHLIYAS